MRQEGRTNNGKMRKRERRMEGEGINETGIVKVSDRLEVKKKC